MATKQNKPLYNVPYVRILAFIFVMAVYSCNDKQTINKEVAIQTPATAVNDEKKNDHKIILFFGNSLTAGYGLEENQSFPSLIQQKLDSLQLNYKTVNAGLSGETTADGQNRIDWVLKQPMDIFVLELGANDMLRGLDLSETEKNLATIIKKVRDKHPSIPIVLTGMKAPPNLGLAYTQKFSNIFPQLAKTYNTSIVPFLLEGVAGQPKLNLADRIHPNAEGAKILAQNVWDVLQKHIDQ